VSNLTPARATNDALLRKMQEFMKANQLAHPQPRTGPVKCNECGKEWLEECTCGMGVSRSLFAFHDNIGGTYKVWSCEDVYFIQYDDDDRSQSLLFGADDLTRIAKMWLALQEADEGTHEHIYADSFDPRYEVCSCGAARQKQEKDD
jgi:hypothetical protein